MSASYILCSLLPLANAADVAAQLVNFKNLQPFVLTGTVDCVTTPAERTFVLYDDSGSATLVDDRSASNRTFPIRPGKFEGPDPEI